MRRFALPVIAVLGVISLPLASAYADPGPAAIPVPPAKPGQAVCEVDNELHSLTGLTATASGYAAVDKADEGLNTRIFVLNSSCQRKTSVKYIAGGDSTVQDPRDIEISPDGKDYYVADTGDSLQSPQRSSIALWKIPVDQSEGTRYSFTYPDGDGPYVSDAFLMGSDGSPVFVTHPLSGPAGIYTPSSAPNASQTVQLKKVGTFQPENTGTANKLGFPVAATVTGGAVSPDGKKIVLRTYSDAYEWDVAGGDTSANIVKALTSGRPRITPLPNEDQGEAISYSHDGKYFLTISDLSSGNTTTMLRYTPDAAVPVKHAAAAGMGDTGGGGGGSLFGSLNYTELKVLVVVVGIIGLGMIAAGVIGITRARKRPPTTDPAEGAGDGGQWGQPELAMASSGRGSARADGRLRRDPERSGGSVYPSGRGGQAPDAGYLNTRDGRPERPGGPRGRSAPPPAGGTYRSGGAEGGTYRGGAEGGTYRGGGRDEGAAGGGRDRGRPDRGGADRGGADPGARGRGGPDRGAPDRRGRDRGGSDGGTYSGGTYSGGTYSSGAYQPPATPPAPPPRTGDGIARSHRPERRGSRGSAQPPRRSGYAEDHDGFDDLRRLTE